MFHVAMKVILIFVQLIALVKFNVFLSLHLNMNVQLPFILFTQTSGTFPHHKLQWISLLHSLY